MIEQDKDQIADVARQAANAAGAILEGVRRLGFAVSDPDRGVLVESLSDVMPACRALASSFPKVRGRVTGLVYQSVEYLGYEGSSALHVVAQIGDVLFGTGEIHLRLRALSPQVLDRLAGELRAALPNKFDDSLRTKLDPELAALEREIGVTITSQLHELGRPSWMARAARALRPLGESPCNVVLAGPGRAVQPETADELVVDFHGERLAVIPSVRKVGTGSHNRVKVQVSHAGSMKTLELTYMQAELLRGLGKDGRVTASRRTKMELLNRIPELRSWIENRPPDSTVDVANQAMYGVASEVQKTIWLGE